MTRMYDRPTLGPDGWIVDETPTPALLTWSLDASGNPAGLVGPDGSTIFVPQILAQSGVPIGIAPSGTMGANGAVTLGTALNVTYSGGLWLYLPAGAAYAGSIAGFYWTVMSSTTVGTVYGDTYTPGTNSPNIPASPTPIVDAGPGAFTGLTTEITAVSVLLPGGSLGKNGQLVVETYTQSTNSAGNKISTTKLGGVSLESRYNTTDTSPSQRITYMNRGSEARQTKNRAASTIGFMPPGVAAVDTTVDTSVDQTLTFTLQKPTAATDWQILAAYHVEVRPS